MEEEKAVAEMPETPEIPAISPEMTEIPLVRGMTVEVLTMKNQITFVGKVEQYARGVLTLREATGGELPPVLFNHEVKLRFFRRDQGITAIASVCGSSPWLWKLDRLERLYGQEQRLFFRQSVMLEAKVQHKEYSEAENGEQQWEWGALIPCKILDISASGLRLSAREPFQDEEHLLVTSIAFVQKEPFALQCCVRRAWQEGGNYLAGCQIEGLSEREQDRLLRAIFVAQSRERQTQKERASQTLE